MSHPSYYRRLPWVERRAAGSNERSTFNAQLATLKWDVAAPGAGGARGKADQQTAEAGAITVRLCRNRTKLETNPHHFSVRSLLFVLIAGCQTTSPYTAVPPLSPIRQSSFVECRDVTLSFLGAETRPDIVTAPAQASKGRTKERRTGTGLHRNARKSCKNRKSSLFTMQHRLVRPFLLNWPRQQPAENPFPQQKLITLREGIAATLNDYRAIRDRSNL